MGHRQVGVRQNWCRVGARDGAIMDESISIITGGQHGGVVDERERADHQYR